jgi:hypothetical protein
MHLGPPSHPLMTVSSWARVLLPHCTTSKVVQQMGAKPQKSITNAVCHQAAVLREVGLPDVGAMPLDAALGVGAPPQLHPPPPVVQQCTERCCCSCVAQLKFSSTRRRLWCNNPPSTVIAAVWHSSGCASVQTQQQVSPTAASSCSDVRRGPQLQSCLSATRSRKKRAKALPGSSAACQSIQFSGESWQ